MLCKFGCSGEVIYINKDGTGRCGKTAMCCPIINQKAGKNSGKTRRQHPITRTKEANDKTSKSLKQVYASGSRKASNYIDKIVKSNKEHWLTHEFIPWNRGKKTGQQVWNKGKTYSIKPYRPKGSNDPLYGEFKKYRYQVQKYTRINYLHFKYILNPTNLLIGLAGGNNAHHVDHVVSTRFGFEHKISPSIIGSLQNLQVIGWRENIRKYGGSRTRSKKNSDQQKLLEDLLETQNLI